MISKEHDNLKIMPRMIHDYQELNDNMIKDHTSLSHADDVMHDAAQECIHRKIDLVSWYSQILMTEADRYKMVFKTLYELFEWNVMS